MNQLMPLFFYCLDLYDLYLKSKADAVLVSYLKHYETFPFQPFILKNKHFFWDNF